MLEQGQIIAQTIIWVAGGLTAAGLILRKFTNFFGKVADWDRNRIRGAVKDELDYTNDGDSFRDQIDKLGVDMKTMKKDLCEHRKEFLKHVGET